MRIALLQYPIVWADKEANLYLLRERIEQIKGQADIAVVPEMFSTGFCTGHPELAETWGGPTCRALQALADEYGIAIVGSMIVKRSASDGLRNRGFMFRPNDRPLCQDKRHLYRTGGEARFFHPAKRQADWEYKGVKIRMLICYDLRFPVWARQPQGVDKMYDLLLVVGNWPEARVQYWDALIAARAASAVVSPRSASICALNSLMFNSRAKRLCKARCSSLRVGICQTDSIMSISCTYPRLATKAKPHGNGVIGSYLDRQCAFPTHCL